MRLPVYTVQKSGDWKKRISARSCCRLNFLVYAVFITSCTHYLASKKVKLKIRGGVEDIRLEAKDRKKIRDQEQPF